MAVTRAEEEFIWCARDGKTRNKDSWWAWLEAALEWVPADLYTEVSGTLPPLEEKIPQGEVIQLKYDQVSFSVTSLMNYARCPRYYYLRYILGVPERRRETQPSTAGVRPSLAGTQRGNIVHRVCEQIRKPEELSHLVDYAAAMEGVQLDSRQKSQLEEIITPYLKSEIFGRVRQGQGQQWKVYQERDFVVRAGGFLVNGLVDQVFLGNRGIEVIDLKSNWISREQVAKVGASYEVQLRLYAWAMAREFGLPVLGSKAYFLIPNQLYALKTSLLDAGKTEEWLMQTCGAIIQGVEQGVEAFPIMGECALCAQNLYCMQVGVKTTCVSNAAPFGENTDIDTDWVEEEIL